MVLRRDHIVGAVLLALAAAAFALSGDLPVGTLGSPGPGMLPMIAISLVAVLALALVIGARGSSPVAEIGWDELPRAVVLVVAIGAATLLYERLGFVTTMGALIVVLLVGLEGVAVWRAALFALAVVGGTRLLLAWLLKSPLPIGPFGF